MTPDASRCPPDASRCPLDACRCLPDASQSPSFPHASRCLPDCTSGCLPGTSRCLPDVSRLPQMLPDASQMPSDVSQMLPEASRGVPAGPRCLPDEMLPDASQIPPRCLQMPPRSFQDASKMPPDAHQMPAQVCKQALFGIYFQVSKHARGFFTLPSWGEAILDPTARRWEASGRHLGGIHRRFSPLTLPASKKASYNIWPSVEPQKTQLFHDIWSPFWHLVHVDLNLGGAWESPWDHPGSTFASRPQKASKE